MITWGNDPSFCLSVNGNRFANGENIQLWKCSEGIGQYFRVDTQNPNVISVDANPNYCVVIDGDSDQNGANIQLWECDGTSDHQKWRNSGGQLQNNANGKCMVVDGNQGSDGNNVQLWSCEGDEQYKSWSFTAPSPPMPHPPSFEYDIIVVGAGVAGSAVAGELSEKLDGQDRRILLIEAGKPSHDILN